MISEEIKDQIKVDINHWFNENFPGGIIKKKAMKDIVGMIGHEMIHYKIYNKFVKNAGVGLTLKFSKEDYDSFSYSATCLGHYPLFYNLIQYYPKYIFVEFIQYLYDIIYNIFTFRRIKHLVSYTIQFIKTLFEFRLKREKKVEIHCLQGSLYFHRYKKN